MSELSLNEAASRLGVRPATVLYWLRAYPDIFSVPCDPHAGPRLSERHLATLRVIREASLEAGLSARRVRELLGAHRSATAERTPAGLDRLAEEIKALRAEVSFLAEESKELQRMVGVLLQYVLRDDGQRNGSPSSRQPATRSAASLS